MGPERFAEAQEGQESEVVGESRWPMATAVLTAMGLAIFMPGRERLGPYWLLPLLEGVLLVVLIAGDPGKINRRSQFLRATSIALVFLLVLSALTSTVLLIDSLINGGKETDSAGSLLQAGSVVWASNVVAFALLYWQLDSGGAAVRAHRMPAHPDLAFPQQLVPDIAPPNWRPHFIDYLYLALTNATAFSPTDTMPLAPWAKIAMAVQAIIAILIFGLVIARAVNVFT